MVLYYMLPRCIAEWLNSCLDVATKPLISNNPSYPPLQISRQIILPEDINVEPAVSLKQASQLSYAPWPMNQTNYLPLTSPSLSQIG